MLTNMDITRLGETVKTLAVELASAGTSEGFDVLLALRAVMHDIVLENICSEGSESVKIEAECTYTYITAVMDMRSHKLWAEVS
jgi:hypothetical protein